MQLAIAVAAFVAASTAESLAKREVMQAASLNAGYTSSKAGVKIVNRCSYPIYLWSIDKQLGCDAADSYELSSGSVYQENWRNGTNGGISIKLSKSNSCGGKDITQFEYNLVSGAYGGNYLDMSFVDCLNNLEDCPGRTDGFYMKTGNTNDGLFKSAVNNEHCPIFNVYNAEEAAKVSYINWDDTQTKWCDVDASTELYMCGGEAPGDNDDDSSPIALPSLALPSLELPSLLAPSAAPSSTEEAEVAAAAVTEAPSAPVPSVPVVKTEVVYVTEFVNNKRHAHAHGRRHQHFHA